VIARKGLHKLEKSPVQTAERGTTIAAVCAMNPNGNFVPPVFPFVRKRMVESLINGAFKITRVSYFQWMDTITFVKWLQHFQKYVNFSNERKILLILDNRSRHISFASVEYHMAVGFPLFLRTFLTSFSN